MNDETPKTQNAVGTPSSTPPPLTKEGRSQPSKLGVIWTVALWLWAAMLVLSAIGRFPEMNYLENKGIAISQGRTISPEDWTHSNPRTHAFVSLIVVEIIVAICICGWWYSQAKLHPRRSVLLQIFGYVLFCLGTMEILNVLSLSLYGLVINGGEGFIHELARSLTVLSVAFIVGSYFLTFQAGRARDKGAA